jgi:hypothetical protein
MTNHQPQHSSWRAEKQQSCWAHLLLRWCHLLCWQDCLPCAGLHAALGRRHHWEADLHGIVIAPWMTLSLIMLCVLYVLCRKLVRS